MATEAERLPRSRTSVFLIWEHHPVDDAEEILKNTDLTKLTDEELNEILRDAYPDWG